MSYERRLDEYREAHAQQVHFFEGVYRPAFDSNQVSDNIQSQFDFLVEQSDLFLRYLVTSPAPNTNALLDKMRIYLEARGDGTLYDDEEEVRSIIEDIDRLVPMH